MAKDSSSGNDFYVSFGSNAADWAAGLKTQLAPAHTEIALLKTELASLATAGATASTELTGKLKASIPPELRGTPTTAPSRTGGKAASTASGIELPDLTHFTHGIASMTAEMDAMVTTLQSFILNATRAQTPYGKVTATRNRGQGQIDSEANKERLVNRITGNYAKPDNPDAVPRSQYVPKRQREEPVSLRDAPSATSASGKPATIAGTSRAVIDEAALSRIVDAVHSGTEATHDVEAAVRHLTDIMQSRSVVTGAVPGAREDDHTQTNTRPNTARDPARAAAFDRVDVLQAQIRNRDRLAALQELRGNVTGGTAVDPELLKRAAAGARGFSEAVKTGEPGRIDKAIESTTAKLQGVPTLEELQQQLQAAIHASGTATGTRPPEYEQSAEEREMAANARKARRLANEEQAVAARAVRHTPESIRAARDEEIGGLQSQLAQRQAVHATATNAGLSPEQLASTTNAIRLLEERIAELNKPLQREQSADKRSEATARRAPGGPAALTGTQRANIQRDLDLGGDNASLRSDVQRRKMSKDDLRRIAASYSGEGYPVPGSDKARVSNEQLFKGIAAANKAYTDAGQATFHDLTTQAIPTEVSQQARDFVKKFAAQIRLTAKEQLALETVKADRLAGGTSNQQYDRKGRARADQLPSRGAQYAGGGDKSVETAEAVMNAAKINRDKITPATVLEMIRKNPQVNPYVPEIAHGVTGTDAEAKELRAAINTLLRMFDAFDKQASRQILSPEVRQGVDIRNLAREEYQKNLAATKAVSFQRGAGRQDLREGAIEALFGGQQSLGSGASKEALSRLLPGLAFTRQGALRPTPQSEQQGIKVADIEPVAKAFRQLKGSLAALSDIHKLPDAEQAPARAGAELDIERRASRVFDAYEQVFKTKLPTQDRQVGEETIRSYGVVQQQAAVEADLAAQRSARDRANRALRTGRGDVGVLGAAQGITQKRIENLQGLLGSLSGADLGNLSTRESMLRQTTRATGVDVGIGARQEDYSRVINEAIAKQEQRLAALTEYLTSKAGKAPAGGAAPAAGGGGTAGGGGGGSTGGGTTGGGGRSGQGGGWTGPDRKILEKIYAEIRASHTTLKTGIKVTGTTTAASATAAPATAQSDNQTPPTTTPTTRRTTRRRSPALSEEGRQTFTTAIGPDLQQMLSGDQRLAAATEIVTRSLASEAQAVQYIRQEFGLTSRAATKFAGELTRSVNDARLNSRAPRVAQSEQTSTARARQNDELNVRRAQGLAQRASARQESESTASAQAERRLELNRTAVAAATDRLSTATRHEIELLRQMSAEGADNVAITAQQVRVYRQLADELGAQRARTPEIRSTARTVLNDASTTPLRSSDVTALAGTAATVASSEQFAQQGGADFTEGFARGANDHVGSLFGPAGFAGRVVNTSLTFIVRNMAAGLVFGLTNALQDAISQGVETESTFVRVSEALTQTGRSSAGLRTSLQGLSQDYGVALKDVYTTAAGLTGLFDSSDAGNAQLLQLTKTAVQLQLISGGALNATEAMRSLASITSAYGVNSAGGFAITAQHIADVATVIQNRLGVNIEETTEGVARLSGQAAVLGLSFEHAATYVAAISKFTGQSGAASGEQLSRILASLQTGKTQQVVTRALKSTGVDVSGALANRDYEVVLDALLGSYSKLDKAERDRVATQLGGQRQAAATNGLLIEGAKVLQVQAAANNANGAAEERARKISEQLAAQMTRLHATFVDFFAVLVQTGVFNAIGLTLKVLLETFGFINHQLSIFNDLMSSNSVTKSLQFWVTAMLGFAAAIGIAKKAYSELGKVIAGVQATTALGGPGRGALAAEAGAVGAGRHAATVAPAQRTGAAVAGAGRHAETELSLWAQQREAAAARRVAARERRFDPLRYAPTDSSRARNFEGRRAAPFLPVGSIGTRVDANGVPVTRAGQFYARRSVGAANAAESMAGRATSLTSRASEIRAAESVTRVQALQARGATALAAGSSLASGALSSTSRAMGFMARNAFLMNSGLIIGAGAAFLVWQGFQSLADGAKEFNDAYDARFRPDTKPKSQADDGGADQFAQLYKKERDKDKAVFSGTGRAIASAGLGGVAQQAGHLLTSGLGGLIPGIPGKEFGSSKEYTELGDANVKLAVSGNKRLQDAAGNQALLAAALSGGDAALKVQLEKIRNSKGLSGEDKDQLVAEALAAQARLLESGQKMQLAASGFSKLDLLTQDQLANFGNVIQTLVGMSGSVSKRYAELVKDYTDQQGYNTGSIYEKNIGKIVTGGDQHTRNTAGIQALRDALSVEQVALRGLPEGDGSEDDLRKKHIDTAIQLAQQLDSAIAQDYQLLIQDAQNLATHARNQGNYTAAAVAGEQQLSVLQRELTEKRISAAEFQAQADQIRQQEAQDRATSAARQFNQQKLTTRNSVELAQADLGAAKATLAQLSATGATVEQINKQKNEILRVATALANVQAAQVDLAGLLVSDGPTGGATPARLKRVKIKADQVKHLQNVLATARADLKIMQNTTGASQQQIDAANLDVQQKTNAAADAQAEEQIAAMQTALSGIAPGDLVRQAGQRLAIALQQQRTARGFGTTSTQYQQATQAVIAEQRNFNDALTGITNANSDLSIAMATAAGKTVDASRLQLAAANLKLRQALKHSGGANSAEVIEARAAKVNAQAAYRDTILQDKEDTVDFNLQMGRITAASAIQAYQQMLKATNLTQKQRRDLMLKIKGLQDDVTNALTASGFNIPNEIKLPTAYEVRRSLGLDKITKTVKDSLTQMNALTSSNSLNSALGLGASNNSDVVQAVKGVQTAVTANGATQVSFSQTNAISAPTAQVAAQIANQVISLINQQTGQQVRANTTTPRLVSTR